MAHDDPSYDPPGEGFDDSLDPEAPSPEDIARFDRDGSTCPSCGSEVYDDAGVCPICGEILLSGAAKSKPWAVIVAGVVLLAFVLFYVVPLI